MNLYKKQLNKKIRGFTVVELIVVIVVIGIIAAISIVSYTNFRRTAVIATLKSDLNSAAAAMENARNFGNSYPTLIQSLNTFTPSQNVTLSGGSSDGGLTYCIDAVSTSDPSLHYYIDSGSGAQGITQGVCTSSPSTPQNVVALVVSSISIGVTWDVVDGASSYTIQRDTNASFTSPDISSQSGNTITYDELSQGVEYYFRLNATSPGGTSGWASVTSATTTIDAPASPPTVTAVTVDSNTTFAWGAPICPSGTTAAYQYRYTILPSGFDSLWVAEPGTSVVFTTSTSGQTYSVQVQSRCYTTPLITSLWGSIGSASFLRTNSWKQIVTGDLHTCGIAPDDKAYCWGYNNAGQLGNNSTTQSLVPVAVNTAGVLSGKTIKSISAGASFTCAIASDDMAYCWGYNNYGQLGNNSTTQSLVPVAVNTAGVLSGKTIKSISVGYNQVCVVASNDLSYCWGFNLFGQLGNNSNTNSSVPVAVNTAGVLSGKTIKTVSSGYYPGCAIASNDLAYCWGYDSNGQLGNNSTTSSSVPVAVYTAGVLSGKTIKVMSVSHYNSCVIASDDLAYCWGYNNYGGLGNNSTTQSIVPIAVDTTGVLSGKTIKAIDGGYNNSCVIASDNLAYCWGYNGNGGLGNNSTTQSTVPVAVVNTGVLSGKTIKSVSAGYYHSCAIASDNQAYCWGRNNYGQLGNNSTTQSLVPVVIQPNP